MKPPGLLIYLLQMVAVAAIACSGALEAGRKNMDLVGVTIVAIAAALGGGTLRDLLLDRNPVFWIADPMYLLVCAITALLTWGYASFRPPPMKTLLIVDAAGLGLFTVIGTRIAEDAGQTVVISCIMGVMTGTAGGVVRDILCGEIPMLFRRSPLYATASALGTVAYFGVKGLGAPVPFSSLMGILTIVALRGAAIFFGWSLPVFRLHGEGRGPSHTEL